MTTVFVVTMQRSERVSDVELCRAWLTAESNAVTPEEDVSLIVLRDVCFRADLAAGSVPKSLLPTWKRATVVVVGVSCGLVPVADFSEGFLHSTRRRKEPSLVAVTRGVVPKGMERWLFSVSRGSGHGRCVQRCKGDSITVGREDFP